MTDSRETSAPQSAKTTSKTSHHKTVRIAASTDPLVPSMRIMVWALLFLSLVAFTWLGRMLADVIEPVVFGMFLCYLIVPMVNAFERLRIPRVLGYVLSSLVIAGAIFGISMLIASSVDRFQTNFHAYQANLANIAEVVQQFAQRFGVIPQGKTLSVSSLVGGMPLDVLRQMITGGASQMFGWTAFVLVSFFFMVFMMWEAERFAFRVKTAYPRTTAARILDVTRDFNRDFRRYVRIKAVASLVTALCAYGIMRYVQLDFAGVLALLIFVANFVPYIGSIIATLIPAALALLQFASWHESVIILAGVTIAQQIVGNLLEPRLQGKGLNISPLVILVALAYFGWMWGVVGMIVCVPIVSGCRLFLEQFEGTRPLARMMRDI